MYEYGIKIKRVIDGDTVVVDVDLGFGTWLMDKHVRIYGVNTPEKNTPAGKAAQQYTITFMLEQNPETYRLTVKDHKADKYGRILGSITRLSYETIEATDLATKLLADGMGKPYFGVKKDV
jgi:micrococcal nuclease